MGTVNVIEGNFLKQNQPAFHDVMYITDKPFCGVWHDVTIKQYLNKEWRKFKQLYTHEGALQKYYLAIHLKAEVTHHMKRFSGFLAKVKDTDKEALKEKFKKMRLITVFEERIVNPFEVDTAADEEEKQPLITIVTPGVATI